MICSWGSGRSPPKNGPLLPPCREHRMNARIGHSKSGWAIRTAGSSRTRFWSVTARGSLNLFGHAALYRPLETRPGRRADCLGGAGDCDGRRHSSQYRRYALPHHGPGRLNSGCQAMAACRCACVLFGHKAMSARIDPFPLAPNFGVTQPQVFLAWATSNSASDIVFQTGDRVWGELKGRQVPLTRRAMKEGELKMLLSLAFGNEVIGVIKSGRDMDRPYGFVIERTAYRYRVNISGAHIGDADDGLSITLRAIPQTPPTLDTLGLPVGIRENLFQPHGLVLICGPTGSGKTTLMSSFYAAVSQSKRDAKILLYEDPIEFLFSTVKNIGPKIRQMQIGRHIPRFAHGLRNAMRCKPTLIGIGEARRRDHPRARRSGADGARCLRHDAYRKRCADDQPRDPGLSAGRALRDRFKAIRCAALDCGANTRPHTGWRTVRRARMAVFQP